MILSSKNIDGNAKTDEFMPTVNSIFRAARYIGVTTCGLTISFCWSLLILLMFLLLEVRAIWNIIRHISGWATNVTNNRGLIVRMSGPIFYGNAIFSLYLSSKFVHYWQNLSLFWLNIESLSGLTLSPDKRIRKRVIFVTSLIGISASVEHGLSMMSATGFDCPPEEYFERYVLSSHGFVLPANEYNLWVAIPIFVLSKISTALWNFQDLIIILICMGLTSGYHKLNLYVYRVVKKEKRLKDNPKLRADLYLRVYRWRRLREAFVRHAMLVRTVDSKLGALVLLSTINNLYFIYLQLYLGIHDEKSSLVDRGYYLISLGWLLFRACGVMLAAGDVHFHSQRAAKFLYSCSSATYNIEVKRLQYQLMHDKVALTGMGLFSLRRELLLEVAAAIIKYELVLIQYDT